MPKTLIGSPLHSITMPPSGVTQFGYNASRSPWSTGTPIQAEDFDAGGDGVADYDTTTGNAGGYYRASGTRLLVAQGSNEVGSAAAQGGLAVTLNPTAIPEGTYSLQLTATSDPNAVVQDQREVRIHSNYKIGSLRLPFVDAEIDPPAGDPLTATRVYDSMTANVDGDFGYGWSLQTNLSPDAFQTTAHAGDYDDNGVPALRSGDLVYLTTPDGQQHAFAFVPKKNATSGSGTVTGQSYSPRFVAVDGSRAELTVASSGTIVGVPGLPIELRSDPQTGEWFYSTGAGNLGAAAGYNPAKSEYGNAYTLTTDDGTADHYDGSGHLADSVDPNGNAVSYSSGVSAGGQHFAIRTSGNHITGISADPNCTFTDPAQFVEYTYDAAGDLHTVRDRALNVTTFTYETVAGVSTHRLIGITDARSVHVVTAGYDPDTHLLASLTDAAGQGSAVSTAPTGDGQTAQATTDAAGAKTETIYDGHGDVIREIRQIRDATGGVTGYRVTVKNFVYGQSNAGTSDQADRFGVTNLNKPFGEQDYAPFVIAGLDAAGLRYTQALGTLVRDVTYRIIDGSDTYPERDAGLFQPASQSVLGADGAMRTTTFLQYFAPGKPSIIRDSHGQLTWMLYDGHGNLTDTINALGEGTETAYDSAGRAIATYRATGAGGTATTPPAVTRGALLGTTTYYAAGDAEADQFVGKVKATTDAAGLTTRYTYYAAGAAAAGNTKAVYREWTDAAGTAHSVRDSLTEYDAAGRATKVTDARGKTTETHYDALGQVAYTVDAYGGKTATAYDARGQAVRTVYADGTETRTAYDALGRAVFTSDRFFTGATVDANGVPSAATDVSALVTRTLYDSLGQVTGTERYRDLTIAIAADGSLLKSVAPGAAQLIASRRLSSTSTTYDDQGRVSESKDAAGSVTHNTYDADGELNTVTTAYGTPAAATTTYAYDRTDNLPAGAVSYDAVTDALGHTTRTYKDAIGRATQTLYADGTSTHTAYAAFGQQTTQTDALGRPTDRYYDLSGRLTDVYLPAVADALNGNAPTRPHWSYTYDPNGNELTQTDPKGHVTAFTYDDTGDQTSRTLPEGETEHSTYDDFGRLSTHTDFDGNTATYTYAASGPQAGMLQQIVYTAAPGSGKATQTVGYTYDEMGRQKTVTDASGTTAYGYDAVGNVIEEDTPEGNLHYVYDPATGRHTETYTDNTDTAYAYDAQGRLAGTTAKKLNGQTLPTPLTTTYTYDAAGDKKTETLPDGEVTTYGYDALNRLTSVSEVQGGATLFSQTYILNDDGTRAGSDESQQQPNGSTITWHTAWTYDPDDRLTGEIVTSAGTPSRNYTDVFNYDLAGNRVSDTHDEPGTSKDNGTSYVYNGDDELTGQSSTLNGTTTFTYDANGSQTSSVNGATTTTFGYDVRNKMVSATTPTTAATYVYDDAGNRVQETVNGTTTLYLTDDANPTGYAQPLEQKSSATAVPTVTYLTGDRAYGQANAAGVVNCLLTDGHGSTQQLTGGSGAVTQAYAYAAFGGSIGFAANAAGTPFLFGGDAIYDPASGLYLHGDGTRGRTGFRFVQADEQGNGDNSDPISLHKYIYGNADSINGFDPTGKSDLSTLSITIGIGAILANIGLTTYSGIRNHLSASAIALQVTENLAIFGAIAASGLATGPIALIAGGALLATGIYGAYQFYEYWPQMDNVDRSISLAIFATYGAFGIAVRPAAGVPSIYEGESSVIPESYFRGKIAVDMRNAPESSNVNAAGFARNAPWFWQQYLKLRPDWSSDANRALINARRSPKVDQQWIQYNPEHAAFIGDTLVHHHLGQGAYAVPLPERVHQAYHSILHPD